jgi:hypothetical protein
MALKKQNFCLLQMPNPYKKLHFIYKKEKKNVLAFFLEIVLYCLWNLQ